MKRNRTERHWLRLKDQWKHSRKTVSSNCSPKNSAALAMVFSDTMSGSGAPPTLPLSSSWNKTGAMLFVSGDAVFSSSSVQQERGSEKKEGQQI